MFLLPFHQTLCIGLVRWKFGFKVKRKGFFISVFISVVVSSLLISILWLVWRHNFSATIDTWEEMSLQVPGISQIVYEKRAINFTADCGPDKDVINQTLKEQHKLESACEDLQSILGLVWHCPKVIVFINTMIGVFALLFGVLLNVRDSE